MCVCIYVYVYIYIYTYIKQTTIVCYDITTLCDIQYN